MLRVCITTCLLVILAAVPESLRAEPGEKVVGAAGLLVLPSLDAQSRTAFRLAAGGASLFGHFGVLRDLALGLGFSWGRYSGIARGHEHATSEGALVGRLSHVGSLYGLETFAKYKLYAGYNVAPYMELGAGYLWITYTDCELLDGNDQAYNVMVKDFGEGSATLSVALSVDWRLGNLIRLGTGVKYTWVPGGTLDYSVTIPLSLSYYWW